MDLDKANLRELKQIANVSDMDIARDTGLHWQTVGKVLKGKASAPSMKLVRMILSERIRNKSKTG